MTLAALVGLRPRRIGSGSAGHLHGSRTESWSVIVVRRDFEDAAMKEAANWGGLLFMVVKLDETTEPEREQECPTSDATRSEDAHKGASFLL